MVIRMSKTVYQEGLVTFYVLTEEEAKSFKEIPCGFTQTNDMIRSVTECDDEKNIFEVTANGINRIRVKR